MNKYIAILLLVFSGPVSLKETLKIPWWEAAFGSHRTLGYVPRTSENDPKQSH
jgi:hypothetical protein